MLSTRARTSLILFAFASSTTSTTGGTTRSTSSFFVVGAQQAQLSLQSQAVLCCEQKRGIHKLVDLGSILEDETRICEYGGEQYQADFFLKYFCGGSAAPITVAYPVCSTTNNSTGVTTRTSTCLSCCLDTYKIYRDTTCGNSETCLQSNSIEFLACEDGCVQTCLDRSSAKDTECVSDCGRRSSGNLRSGKTATQCAVGCNTRYYTRNDACNEAREKNRQNA